MSDSTVWWLIAGAAVVLELLSGTVYLLLLGAGFAAAAIGAHLGASVVTQIVLAAGVGLGAMALWVAKQRRQPPEAPSNANPNVNLDIGQTLRIDRWLPDGTATVRYRGAQWTAVPREGVVPRAGEHRVAQVVGSRLVVEPL